MMPSVQPPPLSTQHFLPLRRGCPLAGFTQTARRASVVAEELITAFTNALIYSRRTKSGCSDHGKGAVFISRIAAATADNQGSRRPILAGLGRYGMQLRKKPVLEELKVTQTIVFQFATPLILTQLELMNFLESGQQLPKFLERAGVERQHLWGFVRMDPG
jgi:hypothetical protein